MSAQALLDVARGQLGVHETPMGSNRTPYGAWYGSNGQPWCDMFVSWCAEQSGNADAVGKFAYTPDHARWFRDRRQWGSAPRVVAIVFFAFSPGDRRRWLGISHVGIVESIRSDGRVVCLEGNTDRAGGRTGGRVMRQVRRSRIAGYGYPAYSTVTCGCAQPGASCAAVLAMQRALHFVPALGECDGIWGKADRAGRRHHPRRTQRTLRPARWCEGSTDTRRDQPRWRLGRGVESRARTHCARAASMLGRERRRPMGLANRGRLDAPAPPTSRCDRLVAASPRLRPT